MKTKIFLILALTLCMAACKTGSEKIYERLFEAIEKNDAKTFDRLVKQLPDIDSLVMADSTAEVRYTPLGYACLHGRCDFVEKLLDRKASIIRGEEFEYYAYDPLYMAIEADNECIVKLLLARGADPNVIYNEYGETPLTFSVQSEQTNRISEMLIDNGANIDGAGDLGFDDEPKYPIFIAMQNNNAEMVRYLIEKGCRLDIGNAEGTPLSRAQENGDKELEALIVKHLKKNYRYRVDENWYGDYEYETSPYTDGTTAISRVYTLEITPDSCVFSGIGFQLYFIEKCTIDEINPDVLVARFYSLIDGESTHYTEPYAVKLSRKGDQYYLNSPFMFGDTGNNTDIKAVKRVKNE